MPYTHGFRCGGQLTATCTSAAPASFKVFTRVRLDENRVELDAQLILVLRRSERLQVQRAVLLADPLVVRLDEIGGKGHTAIPVALEEMMRNNVFFDTCVYHQPGINLLAELIPADNILFASEMLGAVPGIDPETGHNFDDTKRYVDQLTLSEQERYMLFEGNARKVYPRLAKILDQRKAG